MSVPETAIAWRTMFPKLRLIFGALTATIALVLVVGSGVIAARTPYLNINIADVPDMSRPLVRHAIMEHPEWQQPYIMAYARRTDELHRLLDLPVSPGLGMAEAAQEETAAIPATAEVKETETPPVADITPEPAEPTEPARDMAALAPEAAAPVPEPPASVPDTAMTSAREPSEAAPPAPAEPRVAVVPPAETQVAVIPPTEIQTVPTESTAVPGTEAQTPVEQPAAMFTPEQIKAAALEIQRKKAKARARLAAREAARKKAEQAKRAALDVPTSHDR